MENFNYNSLTDKLKQDGIIQDADENFFKKMKSEIVTEEYHEEVKIEQNKNENVNPVKRRINEYDLDLIRNAGFNSNKYTQSPFKTFINIINFKKTNKTSYGFYEMILSKFFPKIYSAKLIKKTISKIFELDIDAKTLLDKTIPYGENNTRYEDLIKYLNCANELQTKLKKKIS